METAEGILLPKTAVWKKLLAGCRSPCLVVIDAKSSFAVCDRCIAILDGPS